VRLSQCSFLACLQPPDKPTPVRFTTKRCPCSLNRNGSFTTGGILAVLIVVVGGLVFTVSNLLLPTSQPATNSHHPENVSAEVNLAENPTAVASSPEPRSSELSSPALHPIVIGQPISTPRVHVGMLDPQGQAVTVECATCHATRPPNFQNKRSNDLKEFHRHINLTHGNISCLSCHSAKDYNSLQLADGTKLEYRDVMQLCAQCHGAQMRDYERGVHGGMNGYWDRSRGPQYKNNCVDCHAPHHPKFPSMKTDFKPQDRFLSSSTTNSGGHHE
jgi:hypothetical protein